MKKKHPNLQSFIIWFNFSYGFFVCLLYLFRRCWRWICYCHAFRLRVLGFIYLIEAYLLFCEWNSFVVSKCVHLARNARNRKIVVLRANVHRQFCISFQFNSIRLPIQGKCHATKEINWKKHSIKLQLFLFLFMVISLQSFGFTMSQAICIRDFSSCLWLFMLFIVRLQLFFYILAQIYQLLCLVFVLSNMISQEFYI